MDESLVTQYPQVESDHFWWSARREFAVELIAQSVSADASILDVGCGSGMTAKSLADAGADVVGVDIGPLPPVVEGGARSPTFVCGDYLTLSSSLGEFDLVMAMDSVEHLENEGRAFEALVHNTKPGGFVLVTVPAYQWLWSSHDERNQHFRRYTRGRLAADMSLAGLLPQRTGYWFGALVVPKAMIAVGERLLDRELGSGLAIGSALNALGNSYFRAETRLALLRRDFLPFGTSVVCLARKPT